MAALACAVTFVLRTANRRGTTGVGMCGAGAWREVSFLRNAVFAEVYSLAAIVASTIPSCSRGTGDIEPASWSLRRACSRSDSVII